MSTPLPKDVHVLAGVIFDAAGRILLAQRPRGKDLAGYWEFPGGKLEPGETRFEALARELNEELGISIGPARPLTRVRYSYPHKRVLLDFWIVRQFSNEPRNLDGQLLRWCDLQELPCIPLLPADQPVLRLIVLPDVINETTGAHFQIASNAEAKGPSKLTGLLCASAGEVGRAVAEGADFAVLTRTLPAGELRRLCVQVDLPVYTFGLSVAESWAVGATGASQLTKPA